MRPDETKLLLAPGECPDEIVIDDPYNMTAYGVDSAEVQAQRRIGYELGRAEMLSELRRKIGETLRQVRTCEVNTYEAIEGIKRILAGGCDE